MSQRVFSNNGMKVLTGWDRILHYFFLVIEDESAEDEYIFTNLDRLDPGMSLQEIKQTLDRFKIKAPESLFDDLMQDKDSNLGNYFFNYDTKID